MAATARAHSTGSGGDVKRTAQSYMSKLLDRDTEAMAAAQLDAMARSLPSHSLPSFISAISDSRPDDKTPLRRHCVRLLSLLSLSHPPRSLAPLLPRMLHSLVRRLRDPDSSVRSACVDASRNIASTTIASASIILRPLSEALSLEQDAHAQAGAALCLAAAIEALGPNQDPERSILLQRLFPRLLKLARSDSFKAKPAILALMGTVASGGGACTSASVTALVACLLEFLANEDWAARKAAAEALYRLTEGIDRRLLVPFKVVCVSTCEARRFDKVKTVRESINRTLEAWKELPGSAAEGGGDDGCGQGGSCDKAETNSDGQVAKGCKSLNLTRSNSELNAPKKRYASRRSPPREPLPAHQRSLTPSSNQRRPSPPLFRNLDRNKKDSDWRSEVDAPRADSLKAVREDKQRNESNMRILTGARKNLPENGFKAEVESDYVKANAFKNTGSCGPFGGFPIDGGCKTDLDSGDLCLIRKQLVQIEDQQSSLIDLLQNFIGRSQNGMRALETRVHGLEIAIDEISREMSIHPGRMANASLSASRCCSLPGAEFLSSKFWRRTEGRYSSRLSRSLAGVREPGDEVSADSFDWNRQQRRLQSGHLINPMAASTCSLDNSDVASEKMLKRAGYVSNPTSLRESKAFDVASASSCSSMTGN